MRVLLAVLAIVAVASCQAGPSSTRASWPPPSGTTVAPSTVQGDVAAILQGMDQARTEGLRRAAGR